MWGTVEVCRRVVRTIAGPGTGETIYVTADGTHWVEARGADSNIETAPPHKGYLRGNCICPQ